MNANTRDYVTIRGRPIRHTTATRDWRCGICESRLTTAWFADNGRSEFRTVCAADAGHSPDSFIHVSTLERRIHEEMLMAGNLEVAQRRKQMGLKDRDTAIGLPRRMRLGRIGRIRQGIMATSPKGKKYPKAVDYFIIDPSVEDAAEREEILADVRAAIARHAPSQDLDQPTVLPICFLANNDEIIGPESYKKRRGRSGTIWCAGDGEIVNWKLTDDFRVEIAGGAHAETGEVLPCPGGSPDGRHEWCEGCVAELEINFAITGYERTGVWMLRTSSMTFRDQFWTQIGIVRALAQRGIIPGLVGVPFLLRRQKESVLGPVGKDGALATVEMPLTTIEIHPAWLQHVMNGSRRATLPAPSSEKPAALPASTATASGVDWDACADAHDPDPNAPRAPDPPYQSQPPAPESTPSGNGRPKPRADEPPARAPTDLLKAVNLHVQVPFDNVQHLYLALRKEIGSSWGWPMYHDNTGWQEAYDEAVKHARAKEVAA